MKKMLYGGRSNGKVLHDGGFGGQPRSSCSHIPDEVWDSIDWSDNKKKEPDATENK